uniref:SCP domain-containing protein n=1 Tax=Mesocestoides corti TaxID=53468 RepID=A0A5K3FBB4_MESCO
MVTICVLVALLWIVKAQLPTQNEREELTKILANVREDVQPPARDMMLMNYSLKLENLMYNWVNRCDVELPNASEYTQYKDTGMILNKHFHLKPSYAEKIFQYLEYEKYYKYDTNNCSSPCDEYKMLIYANTTEFGCAMQTCYNSTSNFTSNDTTYVFGCLFKPGVPQVIDRPYTNGTSCEKCPDGYQCYKKQCRKTPSTDFPTSNETTPFSEATSFTTPSTSPSAKIASSTITKLGVLLLGLHQLLSS